MATEERSKGTDRAAGTTDSNVRRDILGITNITYFVSYEEIQINGIRKILIKTFCARGTPERDKREHPKAPRL